MESIAAHPNTSQPNNFRRRWTAGLISVCPPKADVKRIWNVKEIETTRKINALLGRYNLLRSLENLT
jgi:hypothetical protein